MDIVNFIEAINVFAHSHQDKSKKIFLLDEIPGAVLKRHQAQYADIAPGEQVLLVANDWKVTVIVTGFVVTEKYLYFRCLDDSDYSEASGKVCKGKIPVYSVIGLSVGDCTTSHRVPGCLFKLTVNDKDLGLLNFSDDEAADELNFIFNAALKGTSYKSNTGKKSAAAVVFGKNVTAYKKAMKALLILDYTMMFIFVAAAATPAAIYGFSGVVAVLMMFGGWLVAFFIGAMLEPKLKRCLFRLYK